MDAPPPYCTAAARANDYDEVPLVVYTTPLVFASLVSVASYLLLNYEVLQGQEIVFLACTTSLCFNLFYFTLAAVGLQRKGMKEIAQTQFWVSFVVDLILVVGLVCITCIDPFDRLYMKIWSSLQMAVTSGTLPPFIQHLLPSFATFILLLQSTSAIMDGAFELLCSMWEQQEHGRGALPFVNESKPEPFNEKVISVRVES